MALGALSDRGNGAQVDLKDKWRNLERQHQVGPADCGPQDAQAAANAAQQPPQPLGLVDPATAAAAEHLAATAAMQQMAVRAAGCLSVHVRLSTRHVLCGVAV